MFMVDEIAMLKMKIETLELEKKSAEERAVALNRILIQITNKKNEDNKDNSMLSEENEELKAENTRLKDELAFIKHGRTTTKAIDTRINNMNRSTVRIICLSINGLKMQDILEQLRISPSTYYRVISGKAISDSQHMKDLFVQYEDLFAEYGVEKEAYKDWVANRRAYLGRGYIRDEF